MSFATYYPAPHPPEGHAEKRLEEMRMYQQARKTEKLDRHTALSVLQDLSSRMYPDVNLFGQKTLVIRREDFEKIRAKYLDGKE